jgi:hypothetical protein
MKNSKAIVTLAIGERYYHNWNTLCKDNWKTYADKYGYDVICIDKALDTSDRAQKRSPAWQKCLILSQNWAQNYERVIWMDSDILINTSTAPCITEHVPLEKVGAVDEWSSPTPELYKQALGAMMKHWNSMGIQPVVNLTPQEFYLNYGLPPKFNHVAQTGVLVLSPKHHRHILEKVYYSFEEKGGPQWNYEMRPLSYELLEANCVHWIDPKFNTLFIYEQPLYYPYLLNTSNSPLPPDELNNLRKSCIHASLQKSYFLHFAGCSGYMSLLHS